MPLTQQWLQDLLEHKLKFYIKNSNFESFFKFIPNFVYFPRVYKTLIEKFTMISKIGLSKTMMLEHKSKF
jgi:hypothetical protein